MMQSRDSSQQMHSHQMQSQQQNQIQQHQNSSNQMSQITISQNSPIPNPMQISIAHRQGIKNF